MPETEQQIPQVCAMMGQFVTHQADFNALPKPDRQFAFQQPKAAIAVMVAALRNRPKQAVEKRDYCILRPITLQPVELGPFKADDTFFNKKSGVKMVTHGDNFTSWATGYTEEVPTDEELMPLALTQGANDGEIITDLGGEEKAEVKLSQVWRLMKRQANGEEGALLNNGWANLFYVRLNGVLRAVNVDWCGVGWLALADALVGGRWYVGLRVFSRNS